MRKAGNLKNFNHLEAESRIYKDWEKKSLFSSKAKKSKKLNFSIIMPPPNVTGNLHIGHALNMTIQDILCRYWRMRGKNVLWQPGTDHAGIATQNVVEKNLLEDKNFDKNSIVKEEFLKKIWEWKSKSGEKIVDQIKRLGASPDWKRLKFTLDKDVSIAVNHVFIKLYEDGLIYKDKRLINWDTKLQTAISDLEVEQKEQTGEFVFIKYFSQDHKKFIIVATTRPETLFGDCCIAVNPSDKRYKKMIGTKVQIPLTNKYIPIIADSYVDSEKGSGALKVTPAHDFNDFKIGTKLKFNFFEIFDKQGNFNKNVPYRYQGLDRFKARSIIIKDLRNNGNLVKVEKIQHVVPFGDRSGSIIEPYLSEQWFMDVKGLAENAIKKVKKKEVEFYPKNWTKVFFSWMNEIEPWCISRQIWWGHQLPVWYGPDKKVFVCESKQKALQLAKKHYKKSVSLYQETDVLDTWFSSALWPITTLGWPKMTNEYKEYFPTSVLVTGFDIIFFWVSRMIMQSVYFTKKVPFRKVYIHPLIRDEFGQKMSKSRGNIIDPLELIDKYGADPLRITLASLAAQGKDIKLSEENVKINRNFITKIWNSYNFLTINNCINIKKIDNLEPKLDVNIWIMKNINDLIESVNSNIEKFRFNDAVKEIYSFTKNIFCDWYIEIIKALFNETKDQSKIKELRECASLCFKIILKVIHPFIPFISDEIYVNKMKSKLYLDQEAWPKKLTFRYKKASFEKVSYALTLISKVRNIRSSLKIEPKNSLTLIVDKKLINKTITEDIKVVINSLARVKISTKKIEKNTTSTQTKFLYQNFTFFLIYNTDDLFKNSTRKNMIFLNKELVFLEKEIKRIEIKIKNKDFLSKAPNRIVNENKQKLKKLYQMKNKAITEKSLLSEKEKV